MGLNLKKIVNLKEIDLKDIKGKKLSVDSFNVLYQFLASIRQRDGTPLKDSEGRVTSHLSGLLYRFSNLVEKGIAPVMIFDGTPPDLKADTLESRNKVREESKKKMEKAQREGDKEKASKYAKMSSKVSPEIIESSKSLISKMGFPIVQAPSEGEAQATYMAKEGDVWAVYSQDWDTLLYGAPRLVRNLTISRKKVSPELVKLRNVLNDNNITRKQLIALGVLMGTDYNKGVKGIGPKRGLNKVKNIEETSKVYQKEFENPEVNPKSIENLYLNPEVKEEYDLNWSKPNTEEIIRFLCDKHDFSKNKVTTGIDKLEKGFKKIVSKI